MKAIIFLGTASGAGKTTLNAVYCRHLRQIGARPAPFKASNLSLNSYVTADGREIGMGQAFQAWACGLEPTIEMNPVLLKPTGKGTMQLMLLGKPVADLSSTRPMDREKVLATVGAAFDRLQDSCGVVVCEGSGSPAELNLQKTDLANVGLMRLRQVPAVLVADIERGGAFAAIYGTWLLMPPDVRPLLKGFIINRFRGDAVILRSGIDRITELTGMPCLGVVPYRALRFPAEDSMSDTEGRLSGQDVHQAFLDNLDRLLADATDAGLDLAALDRIASLST
ncbi:MAG: cobyric acid synthase [Candidatus Methanomethylophilus sp.]|nr:cobyric acid synthase [Methanomethylophilus sp.]MDD4222330.1 cobyric acid synthase [Methanomethylophilus sp.]MDD4668948.1 cobyric acid synthase [Methanomethylophilus sp.]